MNPPKLHFLNAFDQGSAKRSRFRRRAAQALWCGVMAVAVAGAARGQSDDFEDGNDTGWTHYDPVAQALGQPIGGLGSTWTVAAGAYKLSAVPSPNPAAGPGRLGAVRTAEVHGDFCLSVDLLPGWDARPDQAIGLLARIQPGAGPGTTNGYAFTYQTAGPDVQISLITNEVASEAAPVVDLTLDPQKSYRMVFLGDGSYLEGRVYDTTDLLHPLVIVSGNEGSYAAGECGLIVFDNGGNQGAEASFDNYFASLLAPPELDIQSISTTEFQLEWPTDPLCCKLQTSVDLLENGWEDVSVETITVANGRFTFQSDTSGPPRQFYRLINVTP